MTVSKPALYTPTFAKGVRTPSSSHPRKTSGNPAQDFVMAALGMSWQLAIVVLVPVFVGYRLDRHFHSLPLYTGVGFLLALVLMALVVWRQVKLFSPPITKADIEHAKRLREQEEDEEE